jgi:hypothetical protein
MTRIAALTVALGALVGCTTVSGDIDGENPRGNNAFFIQDDDARGNDGVIQVYVTDIPDACLTWTAFTEDASEGWQELDLDDILDAYTDNLPETFWMQTVTFVVDDVDDDLGGTEYDGIEFGDPLDDDDEFAASALHQTRYPDEDDFEISDIWSGDRDWEDAYFSDEGSGKIAGHTPDESVRGSVDVGWKDDEGDRVGEGSISFNASRCLEYEDLFD